MSARKKRKYSGDCSLIPAISKISVFKTSEGLQQCLNWNSTVSRTIIDFSITENLTPVY